MKIICISDTHSLHRHLTIPEGDVLIHAGDLSGRGELGVVEDFNNWIGALPHKHKIVIAGNHDFCFEREAEKAEKLLTNCTYLRDSELVIDGIKFYGSPWQPEFFNWAFNLKRGAEIREKWDLIPEDTDILITHGPPYGYRDQTMSGQKVGCQDLLERIEEIQPKYHIFGHIHEAYGIERNEQTTFINASSCDLSYRPVNQSVIIEL